MNMIMTDLDVMKIMKCLSIYVFLLFWRKTRFCNKYIRRMQNSVASGNNSGASAVNLTKNAVTRLNQTKNNSQVALP